MQVQDLDALSAGWIYLAVNSLLVTMFISIQHLSLLQAQLTVAARGPHPGLSS